MSTAGGRHLPPGYRTDIEGMRALAVLLVLVYHAGVPWLPGGFSGVDVFFVISGYVITGLLAKEVRRTGTVDLTRFWSRRARRLLPASGLVLVSTALLSLLVLPQVRWRETGWDIVTSGLYVVNWRLSERSVNYLAEDSAPSPVQHFWSLAVEEQFYLFWPVLVLLGALLARRRGSPWVPVTAVLLAVLVVLPSFAWAVHLSVQSPAEAYFVTTTRLWQLGVGGLVALAAGWWQRLPVLPATLLAWGGPVAVVLGGLLLGPQSAWPGWPALVPTLGAAAMLVGGVRASRRFGPGRLYEIRALQWTGALSYSLYLWHWPLVVLATARWGELSVWTGLAVVAVSAVPAALGYRLVEQPIRHARGRLARPSGALAVGAAAMLAATLSGGHLVREIDRQIGANAAAGTGQGARALTDGADSTADADSTAGTDGADSTDAAERTTRPEDSADGGPPPVPDGLAGAPGPDVSGLEQVPSAITPDPLEATADVPDLYDRECGATGSDVVRCDFGDPSGELVVAAVGDSKIAQWTTALDELGQDRGWQVHVYYRSGCAWTAAELDLATGLESQECRTWGADVAQELVEELDPDVVLTSSVSAVADGLSGQAGRDALVDGFVRRWDQVGDEGIPVVALADSPQPGPDPVYECVADHRRDPDRCAFDYNAGLGTSALREAVAQVPTSTFVTLNDWVCPGQDVCPPVVGDVLVYRQGSHVTDTYAASLADVLGDRLEVAFEAVGVGEAQR
ncbi:acyltransferase family protein [Ornithinimicrobium sp. LYQ92]|uniref:acyltransferase family protein n=1 Tax=Serinicoccus sp. LYQ92 TaxID=3378798 RepID=UPI003852345A